MSALQMAVHNDDCERRASFCAHNHNVYFKTCAEVPSQLCQNWPPKVIRCLLVKQKWGKKSQSRRQDSLLGYTQKLQYKQSRSEHSLNANVYLSRITFARENKP